MEEVVKRHILESFREKYHRASKRAVNSAVKMHTAERFENAKQ
jgi:hypothetical protein